MPAITVAITTHNLEKYIRSCFEELQAQSFQDFEVLVYDDCSTDRTGEMLTRLQAGLGDKLHVILGRIPQKLPSKSRNALMNSGQIHGKYVVFLDGDDSIEPDFLQELYTAAESTGADIALCAYDRVDAETGHVLCREMSGWPRSISLEDECSTNLSFINTALWNKLIRTDRLENLRMPEFAVGEDASFLQELYLDCKKIACIDRVLIHYRVRASSVISNTPEDSIYSFAGELHRIWQKADRLWLKNNLELTAFIHIGLSMLMRADDNPNIDTAKLIEWVRRHFAENYGWFGKNPYFKLSWLVRYKIKGLGLYCAYICHRLKCFGLFLWAYKLATRTLKIDIKF